MRGSSFLGGDETGDGIHSLSSEGREIVLAFEAGAEAQRFALVLKAQGFYEPTPRRMDVRDLEAFCASDERISLLRVPEGTALVPPEDRVDDVEFSPRGAPTAESTEERAGIGVAVARRGARAPGAGHHVPRVLGTSEFVGATGNVSGQRPQRVHEPRPAPSGSPRRGTMARVGS